MRRLLEELGVGLRSRVEAADRFPKGCSRLMKLWRTHKGQWRLLRVLEVNEALVLKDVGGGSCGGGGGVMDGQWECQIVVRDCCEGGDC